MRSAILAALAGLVGASLAGCKLPPPQGAPVTPVPLGSVLDEANRTQEENAEPAKYIVYLHEFELNKNWDYKHLNGFAQARHGEDLRGFEERQEDRLRQQGFTAEELEKLSEKELEALVVRNEKTNLIRGLRLSPFGEDHLRRIAQQLNEGQMEFVVVERSNTSRRMDTRYHYPVHWNHDLDAARRRLVVNTLTALGVRNSDAFVIVGPAYTFGLNAIEAAQAYGQSFNGNQNNGGGGFGGGGGGGGGGLGGFGGGGYGDTGGGFGGGY